MVLYFYHISFMNKQSIISPHNIVINLLVLNFPTYSFPASFYIILNMYRGAIKTHTISVMTTVLVYHYNYSLIYNSLKWNTIVIMLEIILFLMRRKHLSIILLFTLVLMYFFNYINIIAFVLLEILEEEGLLLH